ncbi:MAG TPA: hypothetical protein VE398_12190 [Acidobacteriota bacterium]|nr:hypothetical protein [Acidobacteriota bacterium]
MTRFFVNEREIPSPPLGFSSLDGVLKHVEDNYLPPDSVVRQIHIDGLSVLPGESHEIPRDLLEGIERRERVDISTGSLRDVASDSLAEAASYLERIELIIPSLSSSFQAFPGPEAFANLKELYSGLYWLTLLLDRLEKTFKMSFCEIAIQGIPFRAHQQSFISALHQLVGSQEKGDFSLVADILEYEILPFLPIWRELFSGIGQRVAAASTT